MDHSSYMIRQAEIGLQRLARRFSPQIDEEDDQVVNKLTNEYWKGAEITPHSGAEFAAYMSLDGSGWAYKARRAAAELSAFSRERPISSPTLVALCRFLARPFMGAALKNERRKHTMEDE